jgi:hypothetical protein
MMFAKQYREKDEAKELALQKALLDLMWERYGEPLERPRPTLRARTSERRRTLNRLERIRTFANS